MDATRSRALVVAAACIGLVLPAAAGEITVYKQPQFGGERLDLRGGAVDLAVAGFHDQISSIVVRSGRWEACTQPRFAGDCVALDPGAYPALETLVVREGTWQLCSEPGFEGTCRVYEPGRYPDLERIDNQIGSIRRISSPR
ncbi:MAG TPA: beta/gamma crystallin-related protein [Usitatibacter sp.]|nr:beta/gamma crystallin-related protein [Usitatibacter sp.]